MLLDWITAKICPSLLKPEVYEELKSRTGMIMSINPDGTIEYLTFRRESIRSDSHQIVCSLGGFLQITGSPARLFDDSLDLHDNVFGSTDIKANFYLMRDFVQDQLGIELPSHELWDLTRLDITQNYFLGNAGNVERFLNHHRKAEAGRYQTATFGNSVYVSKGNQVCSGKMYAKGTQLKKDFLKRFPEIMKLIKEDYGFDSHAVDMGINMCGVHDQGEEISTRLLNAAGLIRLECQYGSRYFKQDLAKIGKSYKMAKKHWYDLTDTDIKQMFNKFFDSRVGKGLETMNTKEIKNKFENAAVELGFKSGYGLKAFATWNLIKTIGHLNVYSPKNDDSLMSRSTFATHKQIALKAGLTQADFQSGEVLPFSRSVIDLIAVNSWNELKDLAA
jgi:II/X family phage/plasmid replication protein